MSGSQTTAPHATGIMHAEKSASVGIVARGIHIREEKLSALLMENYVVGVGSKTTLKLYLDPKIPTRETSPRIRNVRSVQNLVDEKSSSEELDDIAYTFSVSSTSKEQSQPMFKIIVHDTTVTIMADSGASVNVLDERDYRALTNRPMVKQTKVRIHLASQVNLSQS